MNFLQKHKQKYFNNLSYALSFKIKSLIFANLLIVADLLSKGWADDVLRQGPIKIINGFFDFSLAYNNGVSFSMFNNIANGDVILSSMAITVGIIIAIAAFGVRSKTEALGFLMIFSGALGNGIDRIVNGHVIDFIDVYYKNWHYPTFNLADCFIFLGVVIIIGGDFIGRKNDSK